jgi:hypothetical protein
MCAAQSPFASFDGEYRLEEGEASQNASAPLISGFHVCYSRFGNVRVPREVHAVHEALPDADLEFIRLEPHPRATPRHTVHVHGTRPLNPRSAWLKRSTLPAPGVACRDLAMRSMHHNLADVTCSMQTACTVHRVRCNIQPTQRSVQLTTCNVQLPAPCSGPREFLFRRPG